MRNPLRDLLHIGDDGPPPLAFPVARAHGDPLRMTVTMPEGTRLIPVADVVAAADEAPAWVHDHSASLQQAADAAGAVIVGAVYSAEEPGQLLTTLSVLFTENLGDAILQVPEYHEGHEADGCIGQNVERRGPHVAIVDRLYVLEPLTPDGDKRPMVVQQWLVDTRWGGMAIVFTSVHPEAYSAKMTSLYEQIAMSVKVAEPVPAADAATDTPAA